MSLSDEDREEARRIAAAMPPWTEDELAELARIAEAAPREAPHENPGRSA